MTTMNAALYQGNRKVRITQIPKPAPGPKDAIVRVRAEGICGSDLQMWWDKEEAETQPAGHEVAGEIVEVGREIDPARVGERVAIDTIGYGVSCGACWYCRMGQPIQCQDPAQNEGGGYAEFIKRRAAGCFPLPDGVTWEQAALVEPLAVSVHAVRRGALSGGETVLVLGSGNIGLTAVAAARSMGAGRIFATARYPQQADMARRLGADVVAPDSGPELKDLLLDATGGRGADVTIETVGGRTGETIAQSVDCTRMQGRIVILGLHWKPIETDWMEPLLKEQSIVFSSCYSILDGRHDYEATIDMVAAGRTPIEQMVTHKFPLGSMQEALDTAYDKRSGSIKVQIHT